MWVLFRYEKALRFLFTEIMILISCAESSKSIKVVQSIILGRIELSVEVRY